jgi:hypothetical protein
MQTAPDHLALAGVDDDGHLYFSDLHFEVGRLLDASTMAFSESIPFLAAAVLRSGVVAGVTSKGVHWLLCDARGLKPLGHTPADLPKAVACFRNARGRELLVVTTDGTLVRIPDLV